MNPVGKRNAAAGLRAVGGVPTLMAGRAPLPAPVFCLMHDQALREGVVATLHRNGVGAFAVRCAMAAGPGPQADASIATAVARLSCAAKAAPGAWLLADCDFYPSESWMLANPHEGYLTADSRIMVMSKDGGSERREYVRVPGPALCDVKGGRIGGEDARVLYARRRVSPFSEAFARASAVTFRRLFFELEKKGLAGRLWGVFIGCYVYGEWNMYLRAPDQGRAALRGFRNFLRRKYGCARALRAAWSDPAVTLTDVCPPREYARTELPPMVPENPRHADYRAAEARAMAQQFSIIANSIKRLAPRLSVGGFFPGAVPAQSDWRRLALEPAIDFLATPLAYENRGPGCGVGSQSPFCDGYSAMGKVWFDEIDTRTFRAGPTNYCYGRPNTLRDSVDLLWRDAGQMLVRGHSGWWLDFGNSGKPPYSWHLDEDILAFHRRFSEIWKQLGRLDRRPLEEIKVFIPSTAARHFHILHHADYQRWVEWTLLGAPVECEVLENLLEGRTRPGKLNVIYGASCLAPADLTRAKDRLAGSGSFVVWMNGAGLFEPGRAIDAARAESLVPLKQEFALLAAPLALEAESTPEARASLGIPAGLRLGQYDRIRTSGFVRGPADLGVPMEKIAVRWKMAITDSEAVPLARQALPNAALEEPPEDFRPERVPLERDVEDNAVLAAMKKDAGGVTHVVYNLPVLNTVLFRALAEKAGCHLYTRKDDVIFASKGLVLIHAAYTGAHLLHFPRTSRILDLRLNKTVRARNGTLLLRLERGETRLFQTVPGKAARN